MQCKTLREAQNRHWRHGYGCEYGSGDGDGDSVGGVDIRDSAGIDGWHC